MWRVLGVLLISVATVQASPKTIALTDYQCGRSFNINEDTTFIYNGDYLDFPCQLELETSDIFDELCVAATTYDTTCNIKVEYHNGFVIRGSPDEEVDCYSSNPTETHCTSQSSLYVILDTMGSGSSYTGTSIVLKASKKSDNSIEQAVSVVVGVIVGIIVLLGIVTVVVIVVCCKYKRRHATGMVYNNPPQMQTTVVTQGQYPQGTVYPPQTFPQQQYNMQGNQMAAPQQPYPSNQPMGQQQPYPGNQPMGQQQPYPGNQPMGQQQPYPGNQPTGYGLPMTGFTSPPGSGYQPPAPPSYSEAEKLASAPAMSDAYNNTPPPYPGN